MHMLMGRCCVHASEHGAVCMLMGRCCVHAGEITLIDVLRVRGCPMATLGWIQPCVIAIHPDYAAATLRYVYLYS